MSLRILIVPEAISLAHVSRMLCVARAARQRGHDVHVASAPPYSDLFREADFEVQSLFSVPPDIALRAIRSGRILYTDDVLDRYVGDELKILRRARPDVVVGDLRLSLDISTEIADVPYVSVLNAYWTRYYAAPMPVPETMPLFRVLGRRLGRLLMPLVRPGILRSYARVFNRFRRRAGLPLRDNLFDVMASPHLTLLADAPQFAPCTGLPDHFRYVGPFLWEPDVPPPDWLDQVDEYRPTVYVPMGSTGTTDAFVLLLRELASAGLQVLATTCGQVPKSDVPEGCFVTELAPASALLRFASATVCHGGNGSIYQSLAHAVPVVCVPTFHDQELNAERVVSLGLGTRLSHRSLTPGRIREAVTQVLEDPAIGRRAVRFARTVRNWNAPQEALWSIEGHCLRKSMRDRRTMRHQPASRAAVAASR
jgi:UDP:flavonoid glycosyltransferase YjiC (YdhE family)